MTDILTYKDFLGVNNGLEVPLFTGGQVPLLFDYSGSTTPIFNRSFIL